MLFSSSALGQMGSAIEKITTKNGLPTNYIFCIAEDANGFIWAGSDKGLLKFDGAKWQVFDIDNGLPGNYVSDVFSDGNHGLWLGISGQLPVWFDINTKKVFTINGIAEDKKVIGVIYGINKKSLRITSTEKDYYYVVNNNEPTIANKIIYKAPILNANETDLGEEKNTILVINSTSNKMPKPKIEGKTYLSLNLNNSIEYSLGGMEDFLDGANNYVAGYNFLVQVNGESLKIITNQKIFERANKNRHLIEFNGQLYYSKIGEGFRIINENGAIKKYTTENGLSSNEVNKLFVAGDSALYIATLGGGINVLKNTSHILFPSPNEAISQIQFANGNYYVLAQNTIKVIKDNAVVNTFLFPNNILSFYVEKDKLYVGDFDGLHEYKINGGKIEKQNFEKITAGISGILPYQNTVIASTYGLGLKNNSTEVRFANTFDNIEKITSLTNGYACLSYEKGFFTTNKSLNLVKWFTKKDGLLSDAVYDVHEYKDTLWVATKNGINVIANNKIVKTYNQSNTKSIYIFTDNAGQHWVVGNTLGKINKENIISYKNNLLFSKNDNVKSAYYNATKSELVVGTQEGFLIIDLNVLNVKNDLWKPNVYKIALGNIADTLKQSYTVAYNFESIKLYFGNLNNGLFKPNQIFYKIEGKEDAWLTLSDSMVLIINELRPGNYKIFAKTVAENGQETEAVLITTIKVEQIIWFQKWMLLIYLLGIASIAYGIANFLNKQKYKHKMAELKTQTELENERQRISRDLHDNMGAYTSALLTNVQQVKNKFGDSDDIVNMNANANKILGSLRETIWVLNNNEISLQELSDSFKDYCFRILRNYEHINFNATENFNASTILPAKTAIHLNKILQEAFQNIIKHANCTDIYYKINNVNKLEISLEDNGIGEKEKPINYIGNGLKNMKWRAKEIDMDIDVFFNFDGTKVILKQK